MSFSDIVSRLAANTQDSLALFAPELCICGTIIVLLFVRLFNADRQLPASIAAMAGTVAALGLSAWQYRELQALGLTEGQPLFTGLLVLDPFTAFFRIFLLLFLVFVVWLTIVSGIPDEEDGPDFYILLLGSTLGMMLMASANHLLMVFLAVEMTSVPSYAMVGFLKGRKASSEAALKYVVYGAGAAGVMLYGISLLAGLLGTAHLPALAQGLVEFGRHHSGFADPAVRTLALGILMVLVGIAFKLSLFPFHFWCPDAFEGAAAEVGGFLSVASKAGAFALLVRFCLALVGQSTPGSDLSHLYFNVGIGLGIAAAVTATFGNLAAYAQTNIKRLLAYSTIAHAGYMLMAVSAMMVVLNSPAQTGQAVLDRSSTAAMCLQGLLYYLAVYFFMNLGAFAVVALIRNQTYSEQIADYAGLVQQAPVLAVAMFVCLFSLVGLPPLGGFMGKFMVFSGVIAAAEYSQVMWGVFIVGLINTVFSLVYYVRVLREMFIAPLPEGARPVRVPFLSEAGQFAFVVSLPILLLGVFVDPISGAARDIATWLLRG
ncbi:MAG: NADH-quinone oxidoreductase subunit N [Planctomycetaceae bacterium]